MSSSLLCLWLVYMVKVSILHMQLKDFAAIGVDQRGTGPPRAHKASIFSILELWMKTVHRQNSDQYRGNSVLPGVVDLVCLAGQREMVMKSCRVSLFSSCWH